MGEFDETNPTIPLVERSSDLVIPESFTDLDKMIYESSNPYDSVEIDALRLAWIRFAVQHSIDNNALYRRLATQSDFNVTKLKSYSDLYLVPTLSSALFKRSDIINQDEADALPCTSSGTRGARSTIWRNQETLERFIGSVTHGISQFYDESAARIGFVIGPSTEEAGDLWFSYVLSLINLIFETNFYVRSGRPCYSQLYSELSEVGENEQPVIVAPPSLLYDFLSWMEKEDKTLNLEVHNALVITSGGWKRREKEAINRNQLERTVEERLGIVAGNCRDFFNMVEINSVIFECEFKNKHIPPWLVVIPRNVADMTVQPEGEVGLLTFLDPTATSYPAFICSEDFGAVQRVACACGRNGDVLTITRRLAGIEERGCGQKMNRYGLER